MEPLFSLILGVVLLLIGAFLHHENKESATAWWLMAIGFLIWIGSVYQ